MKTVSLEVAKKLKAAGWPQTHTEGSLFWCKGTNSDIPGVFDLDYNFNNFNCLPIAYAPTLGELWGAFGIEELPNIEKQFDGTTTAVAWNEKTAYRATDENAANALALVWVALQEAQ